MGSAGMAEGSSAPAGEPSALRDRSDGEPRRQRRPLDHVQLVPGDVVGTQLEHRGDVGAEQFRRLAGDAVDQVESGVGDAGARAGDGRPRPGPPAPCGRARRAAPARSSARRARRARRARTPRSTPPAPSRADAAHAAYASSTSSGLVSTVTSACGVRCGRKSSSSSLEPVRPQQARGAAAEVERVEAAHVVRRPLPLPLGGERRPRTRRAGGRPPPRPARRPPGDSGTDAKSQ